MYSEDKYRIDKFLWAVRIYKTRSLAAEACKKGRIIIDNIQVKPSRILKKGDTILIRKLPVIYTIKVKELTDNRIPAKRVPEFIDDLTSVEELEKLKVNNSVFYTREKGTGRPTKKERRILDKILLKSRNSL
jgi:ribosome-associated heat shock protein Hsp15